MDTVKKLIRCDLIMMLHGSKELIVNLVLLAVCYLTMVLFGVGSLSGLIFLMLGIVMVTLLHNTEKKGGCTALLGILPAERQTVVTARYILCGGVMTAVLIVTAVILELLLRFCPQDANDNQVLMTLFGLDSEQVSVEAFCRLTFYGFYMISLIIVGNILRSYFKNGPDSKKNSLVFVYLKAYLLFMACIILFMLLPKTNVPFIKALVFYAYSLATELLRPAGGILMILLMLAAGYCWYVYTGVSAALEYEKRDL